MFGKSAESGSGGYGGAGAGGTGGASGAGGNAPAGGSGGIFSHAAPEGHAKKVSEVLGEIVWLMSQSPLITGSPPARHKQFFIADLEWPAAQAAKGKCR